MVVIPNTLELKTLWVSAPLEDEVRAHPHLSLETDYLPMPFSGRRLARPGAALPREHPHGQCAAAADTRAASIDRSTESDMRQFAFGFRLDEPGRGGNEAVVSSIAGTSLRAAWRTASEASVRAISASRFCTTGVLCCAMRGECADPDGFDRVFRELDQPGHRVDVGPALQEWDHRDALVRLWG